MFYLEFPIVVSRHTRLTQGSQKHTMMMKLQLEGSVDTSQLEALTFKFQVEEEMRLIDGDFYLYFANVNVMYNVDVDT